MIKKILNMLIYCVVAVGSFLFFLYLSFPYHAFKLSLLSTASDRLDFQIQASELSHEFPLGVSLNKVVIESPGVSGLSLDKVKLSVDFWSLLVGALNIRLGVKDSAQGEVSVLNQFDLFKLVTMYNDKKILPSGFKLSATNFDIGNIINFFLDNTSQDPKVNLLLIPILESVSVHSKIKSEVDFKTEGEVAGNYSGLIDVDFNSTKIVFDDSMGLPDQLFTKAKIKATLAGGVLNIDKSSTLSSDQMTLDFSGSIKQNEDIERSVCNLSLKLDLKDELKDQLSFLLDIIAERTTNGSLSMNLKGPIIPGPRVSYN